MTVDGLLGRAAAGLATIALLGMAVHLCGGQPREQHRSDAHRIVPDNTSVDVGDAVGLRVEEVWLTNAVATPDEGVPQSPLLESFTAEEVPAAGESFDSVVASLGTQVTNSLGPAFTNVGIILPFALAPKILQQVVPLLDTPVVDALPAEASPADVLLGF